MGKNKKNGPKANVFKVAGAKSLKKSKAKAVNLGLKNANLLTGAMRPTRYKRKLGQPIKYQRQPGSRRYIDYTQQQLDDCIAAIRDKKYSQRDASEIYNIPRSTIKNRLANKPCSKPGRRPVFSEEEEDLFVTRITTLSEFGFPLSNHDIKMVIKDYLASRNKSLPAFKNNLPGKDWLKFFFDRHKELCEHLENKYDKIQFQDKESYIIDFIEHVSEEIEGVPSGNIYSYDEFCFWDDPTKKSPVCRRGYKYPETTLSAKRPRFSVMFSGNAEGETIPPYIIYKSEPRCSTWTENGPKGAGYNCTKHGWIDQPSFENWFLLHLLPYLKKKNGRKVLIGDNLSSHISGKVLAVCNKYNIRFVCLPHRSSKFLQPLDIAYFQPIKALWTQLLLDWRSSQIAKKQSTILKADFPHLLHKALNALTDTQQNIIDGFERTGIFPIDVEKPLSRLPKPGNFINTNLIDNIFSDSELEEPAPSGFVKIEPESPEEITLKQLNCSISSINDIEGGVGSSNDVYLIIVEGDEVLQIPIQFDVTSDNPLDVDVNDHVMINRGTSNYPGKVLAIFEDGAYIHCMKRWKSLWRWPSIMREQFYDWDDIVCKIEEPKLVRRGCFIVSELEPSRSDFE